MATTSITLTHTRASDYKGTATMSGQNVLARIQNLLAGVSGGIFGASALTVSQDPASATVTLADVGGAVATGTITFSSSTGAWTATVNGVAFAGTSAGDDDAEGDDLAGQINDSVDEDITGIVTAENVAGVVTITAVAKGTGGNAITLAVTGTGVARSAATLASGANGSVTVTVNGTAEATTTTNLTDAAAASLVATELNANTTINDFVVATSSAAVVTVTAAAAGEGGNAITLTSSATSGTAVSSAAKLAGGTSTTYTI